jgi:hypothetical protein
MRGPDVRHWCRIRETDCALLLYTDSVGTHSVISTTLRIPVFGYATLGEWFPASSQTSGNTQPQTSRQTMYYKRNTEARSRNHCWRGEAVSIKYVQPELPSMQSACTVLFCHLWPVWLYHIFPHYLINGTIFGKKLLNIQCVFWFSLQLLSETFLIIRRIQRDIVINAHRSSCEVHVILVIF